MKIAITTEGRSTNSQVYQRFGRTPWLLIVDSKRGQEDFIANQPNEDAVQGAGIQTAQLVANSGVGAVLTGHCGPKAFQALQAAGVAVYVGVEGPADEAMARLEAGELTPAQSADKNQHWV